MPDLHIRDQQQDRRLFIRRAVFVAIVATALLFLLLARMFVLQVVEHEHYATLADGNRVRVEPITPTRGLIFDRNGRPLAENVPTYQLEIVPEQIDDLAATLDALSEVVDITEQDRERFYRLMRSQRRFQPIPVRQSLSESEVARFSVERQRFPGVDIRARLTRHYPQSEMLAHVVGHLGAMTREDLQRIDRSRYSGTTRIGKSGIEFAYEPILHGAAGSRRVETNAQGRILRTLNVEAPAIPGDDLYLSLDIGLQRTAWDALEGRSGAVVALDTRDGSVLAMVSRPSHDPNLLVHGLGRDDFARLESNPDRPLFNRATRGRYPPGSTIKPFLGLAGLEATDLDPHHEIECTGEFFLEGRDRPYRDWRREGHGDTDFEKAIAESCDIYYYRLAMELGIDNIHRYLTAFGLGRSAGIDIPGDGSGLVPSRDWKRRAIGESWYHGETVIAGIGQGYMLATPLQLAKATATLANRGIERDPRLLHATRDAVTRTRSVLPPPEEETPEDLAAIPDHAWQRTIDAMIEAVHGTRGTARGIGRSAPYRVAGKTGTAQVFSLGEEEEYEHEETEHHLRDHGLFVGFAPAEDPRIAVAVVVEHGGGGASAAAPVARAVMDNFLLNQLPEDQGND